MKMRLDVITMATFAGLSVSHLAYASDYHLEGVVSGVRSGGPTCYIAIDDTSRTDGYPNAWHTTSHDNICKLGKLAFVTGQRVRADMVRVEGSDAPNLVDSLQITTKPVSWPPYRS